MFVVALFSFFTMCFSYSHSSFVVPQFHGGLISEGSELQIEVAEILWKNVQVSLCAIRLLVAILLVADYYFIFSLMEV